jgi:hypothetical protein
MKHNCNCDSCREGRKVDRRKRRNAKLAKAAKGKGK